MAERRRGILLSKLKPCRKLEREIVRVPKLSWLARLNPFFRKQEKSRYKKWQLKQKMNTIILQQEQI